MKLSGELDYRIRYDVEHDLFHAQNVFNDEYITPTFVEYVRQLEAQIEKMKCCYNCSKWYDGECEESPKSKTFFCADFKCDNWEIADD